MLEYGGYHDNRRNASEYIQTILAHVMEEKSREPPFRKFCQIEEIYYDGKEENFKVLD